MTKLSKTKKFQYALSLARLSVLQATLFQTLRNVRKEKLSYLGYSALYDLAAAVQSIERRALPGIMIEAGCGMGGSALVAASAKRISRPFFIYDTFELIPPPTSKDGQDAHNRYKVIIGHSATGIRGDDYYGYIPNLTERIENNFARYGLPIAPYKIQLVKGLFQDTLKVDQPVSFAHLDCDWYDSVMTCLNEIEPHLVEGGILIIDDYFDWTGAHQAVDEYFSDKRDNYTFIVKSRLHIQKKANRA